MPKSKRPDSMDFEDNGKVSVIICLYDVARYLLDKGLSCVRNQTWHDLEIILVNDGSTDETPDICNKLAAEDPRIRIVNKANGGLGSARNAGLDVALGDFVWFYDVDDDADLDLVEKNVRWMQEYSTDMNIFGIRFTYPESGKTETSHFKERLLESNAELKAVFLDELFLVPNGNGFAWNKFYRRSFIERTGARFGGQRIQQDELFNLKLYPFAERVYVSSLPLYHYYFYESGNNRSRYIPDRILIYESVYDGIRNFMKDWQLEEKRLESNAYWRFYQGIETSILFNTFHPDAPSSRKWKREEVLRILSRPKVVHCLDFISANNHFGIENRLFLAAYRARCYPAISFLRWSFNGLRKIFKP